MKKPLGKFVALVVGLLCLAASAMASEVVVGASDYTGSRTTPGASGVTATDGWLTSGFTVTWDITETSGLFTYTYTLSGANNTDLDKELSHWILEVSPNASAKDFTIIQGDDVEVATYSATYPGKSNPGLPGSIYGMKFDLSGDKATISFTTTREPVWGDFYAADGHSKLLPGQGINVIAYNTGIGTDPTSTDFTDWIPTPDSNTIVPEPSLSILALVGLMGGAFGRRISRRKQGELTS